MKGETHEGTLYLETEYSNGTDLKRIMPLFEGKKISPGDIYERSRRCAYVGFSRPKKILCVAMRNLTYNGHEEAFANWKVVEID